MWTEYFGPGERLYRPAVIFCGTGNRISAVKNAAWHPEVDVYFAPSLLDRSIFIVLSPFPVLLLHDESLLFLTCSACWLPTRKLLYTVVNPARGLLNREGACHYLTNRFQMKAPVAPSRSLREAFKRAPRSLRGACLREGFAEPPRRHHEPFAEVAHTEGSTKTPWRVHEASSKGPWMMNCMFLLDHDCNRVWSILYCF